MENEKGKLNKTGSGGERNREVIGITEKESVSKRDTYRQRKEKLHREILKYIFYFYTVDVISMSCT